MGYDNKSSKENVKVIILSSKIMGAESLLSHGFDYLLDPFNKEKIVNLINRVKYVEEHWVAKINQWKIEGAEDLDFVPIPGAIGWIVPIEKINLSSPKITDALVEIAKGLFNTRPHIEIDFNVPSFDVESSASSILNTLQKSHSIAENHQPRIFGNCFSTSSFTQVGIEFDKF